MSDRVAIAVSAIMIWTLAMITIFAAVNLAAVVAASWKWLKGAIFS